MKSTFLFLAFLPILMTLGGGCNRNKAEAGPEVLKEFRVKGVVKRVEDEGRTLVIAHEAMPGYMAAMTMPFRTRDASESEGLAPGDEIEFTYKVAELSSWVEAIEPTGKQVEIEPGPQPADQSSKLLKSGDLFPDFHLQNEYGEPVNLKDYRGSVVALTFIFTRCPVPEYCPTMMRNFSKVEAKLKADPQAPENYQLLTVSFDSEYDTPEVLKAFGEQFGQESPQWNLLGSRDNEAIRTIGDAVGLKFAKSDAGIYSHNLRTAVIDPEGRLVKLFTDESWKPEELIAAMKQAAQKM
ncbi:MAG: SCO family protein [Verrucomicrobiae bacterium]|nr:SCO family protein [Verrucomicrobiae bacterium]